MNSKDITEKYLNTLGLKADKPHPALLGKITQRHVASFPFSSIGPLLGDDLPLDRASLFDRIVTRKRGGYCFEQNGLIFEILKDLGYSVRLYLARVIYNQDIHPPLTHRITRVEMDNGHFIVDVGFGPLGPYLPVSMTGEKSHEKLRSFWIAEPEPGVYHMQTNKDGIPFSLYKFELNNYAQADCELGHFYSHKHPKASFVNNLVVSIITDREVCSIRNRKLNFLTLTDERIQDIENAAHLKNLLKTRFEITVSDEEAVVLFKRSA